MDQITVIWKGEDSAFPKLCESIRQVLETYAAKHPRRELNAIAQMAITEDGMTKSPELFMKQ